MKKKLPPTPISYFIQLILIEHLHNRVIFPLHCSSLRCTRIRVHIQLFIALALSCFFWCIWYKVVVQSTDVITENPLWCIYLHIALQYLMLCSYFWMFCEGIHLHLVLVVVFVKDALAMKVFRIIGWILPLTFVSAYSFMRKQNEEDSKMYVYRWQSKSNILVFKSQKAKNCVINGLNIEITITIPHSYAFLHCLSYFPRFVRWHDNNIHHNPNTKNPQVLDWRKPLPVDSCYSCHNCADMFADISDKHRTCAHHEASSKVDITGTDCYQESGTSDADSCEYCQIFEVLPRIASYIFNPALNLNNWIIINFHKIPLFGLQHILFPLRPARGSAHEFVYQITSAFAMSLQGFIVSVIFCFANHEVISAVKSYLNSICPRVFRSQNPENYFIAPSTTKDIMVWEQAQQELEMIDHFVWYNSIVRI